KISAGGRALEWKRNAEEMYAFQIEVPEGAEAVDVRFYFLLPSGEASGSATAQLLGLSWNQVLLYPKGVKASDIQYAPSLRLPAGWKYGTALSTSKQSGEEIDFASVSLETLVDSPVFAGKFFKTINLAPGAATSH